MVKLIGNICFCGGDYMSIKMKERKEREIKKINVKSVLLSILAGVLGFVLIVASVNSATVADKIEKASSYSQVTIDDQLVPQKDENGGWVFTTDRDSR